MIAKIADLWSMEALSFPFLSLTLSFAFLTDACDFSISLNASSTSYTSTTSLNLILAIAYESLIMPSKVLGVVYKYSSLSDFIDFL